MSTLKNTNRKLHLIRPKYQFEAYIFCRDVFNSKIDFALKQFYINFTKASECPLHNILPKTTSVVYLLLRSTMHVLTRASIFTSPLHGDD